VIKACHQNWGEDRVMYFDKAGKLTSMLVTWTDQTPYDPFVQVSAGKSWFRVDDLLELAVLLKSLPRSRAQSKRGVK